MSKETLFDEPSNHESGSEPLRAPYLLTNQNNLYEFLSWARVTPKESFAGEYYTDLSARAPGRVVLLGVGPPAELLKEVLKDEANLIPVALELGEIGGECDSLGIGNDSGQTAVASGKALAWAPSAIVPLMHFTRVCFRSTEEKEEFEARKSLYENLDLMALPRAVAPELFQESSALRFDDIVSFLSELSNGQEDSAAYDLLDRQDGMFALLLAAADGSQLGFQAIADALNGHAAKHRRSGRGSNLDPLEELVRKLPRAKSERIIAKLCFGILTKISPSKEWRPSEILRELMEGVQSSPLSERDRKTALAFLKHTQQVLDLSVPFEPRSEGFVALRALELVLIRKDPSSYLESSIGEGGIDPVVRMVGAGMVGLLTGLRRLPLALKPQALMDYLSLSAADSSLGGGSLFGGKSLDVGVEPPNDSHPQSWRLIWENEVLAERTVEKEPLIDVMSGIDFTSDAGIIFATEIARRMKWRDCVVTEIILNDGTFSLEEGSRIRVAGVPKMFTEIVVERLLQRVVSESIPTELDEYIRRNRPALKE